METTGEWYVDINSARAGGMSARSSDDPERYTGSWIQTNVTGPGIFNFSWIIDAAPTYDTLTLFDNGVEAMQISGYPENWTDVNYDLAGGSHTLRWAYERTSWSKIGENGAWLDNVSFVQFDAADFGADATYGPVALTVNFTDYSTGTPTAGCGTLETGRHPPNRIRPTRIPTPEYTPSP
ncbi:hypothetical protein [Methanogenium cariaci]|uniref:hypothetical protein n=1 Tax=Methanogenium cariaci TaxID=2197 RepID=UPI0007859AB9|nr:hypothetical protein [Methanogenium cariaci]